MKMFYNSLSYRLYTKPTVNENEQWRTLSSVFRLFACDARFAAQRMEFPCHRAAFFPHASRNNDAFSWAGRRVRSFSWRRCLSPGAMRNDIPRMNRQTRARTNIQDAHAIVRLRPESPLFRGGFFFRERSIQSSTLYFPRVPQSMPLLLLDRDVHNSRRDVSIVGDMSSKAASWEI